MKLDQVAYYCATKDQADHVKRMFGLTNSEWIKDKVTAMSSVYGGPLMQNVAELQFNYALGIELEILRYIDGPSWHGKSVDVIKRPIISHVGFHLEDGEEFPEMAGCELVQETFTKSHTSEYLTTGAGRGRLYHYRIFEVGTMNYAKYIRRVRDNEVEFQAALKKVA